MLAGASVGTVEYRSITEPIREICPTAEYLEATASEIDASKRIVTCQSVVCDGNSCQVEEFEVTYDKVIVTVGAQTNTFGIPGVREYCCFLKQVEDARRIRTAIVNCFERANLPHLSEQERVDNLTFCCIGAGPTGIEFAAELRDFVEQDAPKYYPSLLKYVRIKVIEASSSILAPFDKSLQEEAIKQMNQSPRIRDPDIQNLLPERFKLTELLLDSSVKEVTEKSILLNNGNEIRYGLSVWAAGNGPLALTLQVIDALGADQAKEQNVARGRVAVDPWMRAVGGSGNILAFGDCSCIVQGGQQLPATAQVASQQGEYLASLMNRKFNFTPHVDPKNGIFPPPIRDAQTEAATISDVIASFATNNKDHEFAKPFQFLNLGILAYTGGGSALAQVAVSPNTDPVKSSGQIGNLLWRSVYLSKQVSWRNRLLVLNDWTKRVLFGRDITRV
jgi:NADH dehydrogenase FAD-containing subunit